MVRLGGVTPPYAHPDHKGRVFFLTSLIFHWYEAEAHLPRQHVNPNPECGSNTKRGEVEGGENPGKAIVAALASNNVFTKNLMMGDFSPWKYGEEVMT